MAHEARPDVRSIEELPAYDEAFNHDVLQGRTEVNDNGRVDLDPNSRFFRTLSRFVPNFDPPAYEVTEIYDDTETHDDGLSRNPLSQNPAQNLRTWSVRLNIVIQVVGSRGDVQPFVALGNELQKYGHRVRLATHAVFEQFVISSGLEFFPIGGDPADLMAYMVKNPGLIPSMKSLRTGDIKRKRKMVQEILEGCWRSCLEPDPITNTPFVANAIIANPPSFGHVHCAQALGIPVHLMFTMPWTSTRKFPHPLANFRTGDTERDQSTVNFVSYAAVEWLTWQGLGDVINDWRHSLELEPIPLSEGPCLAETLRIPFTYCWSPDLVAKPMDWGSHIDVCGFFFRDPPSYDPPKSLEAFIDSGPPPVYIGFGSIVIEDSESLTEMILEAVRITGCRAIISRGWSKLGSTDLDDTSVFYIDDCPHEWLFQRVAAVVHHGGAGTTACGLRYGCPTAVIPFFGDQPFWGDMVAAAGVGPNPIPYKALTADSLAAAIRFCFSPEVKNSAQVISQKLCASTGVTNAVRSFHAQLPLGQLRCDILQDQPAVWVWKHKGLKLKVSGIAAEILEKHLKIDRKKLELHSLHEYLIENRRWDPVTGTTEAAIATYYGMLSSVASIFVKPIQVYRSRPKGLPRQKAGTRDTNSSSNEALDLQQNSANPTVSVLSSSTSLSPDSVIPTQVQARPSTSSGVSTPKSNVAASMALASATSVGQFFHHYSKGVMIDLPLAFAEGSRNLPKLLGDEVPDYGKVTDWKSGFLVSGKSIGLGLGEGFADLVVKPYKGARKHGVLGGALGVVRGVVGFSTKVSSAAFGVVAYPGFGIYQSIRSAVKTKTRKAIVKARQDEAAHYCKNSRETVPDDDTILQAFEALRTSRMSS